MQTKSTPEWEKLEQKLSFLIGQAQVSMGQVLLNTVLTSQTRETRLSLARISNHQVQFG
jgi:hypothetical protein